MTKRDFGKIIHEARIKKGLRLRDMELGAARHSHIECGHFEMVLYHERGILCKQLSLDRKELDEAWRKVDLDWEANKVPEGIECISYIACTKESIDG
nr:hypothetical protein [uncultured Sphaerochaeta sp.]